jgi:hypothetical protein
MVEANRKSYKERMREARAAARAQRLPEKAAWQRRAELTATARMMALEAVKLTIRDRGDKVQNYTPAQLKSQADLMMGPWLILKAQERIAERNSKHMSKSRSPVPQAFPFDETHAQNGAQ